MDARVKFRHETLHQTGTIGKLLLWLQEEPKRGRNTNITQMANHYCLSEGGNSLSIKQAIQKMVNVQMLSRYGSKRRANFYINYLQKDIPGYILDNAPAEERERVKKLKESLQENQHISDEGCLVTQLSLPESSQEEPSNPELEESEPEEEQQKSSSDMSEENTTNVPIKIEDTERGLSISITLNLNINK